MVELGKKAPSFVLKNSDGKKISLKEFVGKNVVLYFYPKDMTSGCTAEACDFRDNFPRFGKINAVIIGVSADSEDSHKKFASKYNLPFMLLSDPDKSTIKDYGVWKEKSMYGKKYMGIERTTFLIDKKGKIARIFPKVKVSNHVNEVIAALNELEK